jgi:hypothetical protein
VTNRPPQHLISHLWESRRGARSASSSLLPPQSATTAVRTASEVSGGWDTAAGSWQGDKESRYRCKRMQRSRFLEEFYSPLSDHRVALHI